MVDAERLSHHRRYTRNVAWLLRQAISAGEIPAQDVDLSAAAIVGALAEALVGPLSEIPENEASADVIVSHIVRFCRQAVGATHGDALTEASTNRNRRGPRTRAIS
jgi:hypothetical protein